MLSNPLSNQILFFPDCLLYVLVISITSHTGCLEGPTSNGSYYIKFDVQLGSLYPTLVPRISLGGPGNEATCNQCVKKPTG